MSSEQVAADIETRMAKKYNWTEGVGTGVSDYVKAYSTWDYTKQAMDYWAKLARQRLDEAQGKTLNERVSVQDSPCLKTGAWYNPARGSVIWNRAVSRSLPGYGGS